VEVGEHLGVVGRVGSGKSSWGMVIFRMPDVRKDNFLIDNVDIARTTAHDPSSRLAMILQEPICHWNYRSNLGLSDTELEEITRSQQRAL
jgi:ABC-type multidrug transport system fused ATPase/permease subunit